MRKDLLSNLYKCFATVIENMCARLLYPNISMKKIIYRVLLPCKQDRNPGNEDAATGVWNYNLGT